MVLHEEGRISPATLGNQNCDQQSSKGKLPGTGPTEQNQTKRLNDNTETQYFYTQPQAVSIKSTHT